MSEIFNMTNIASEWSVMLSAAQEYFDNYDQKKYDYHQCIVLCMDNEEQLVYPIAADSVDELIQKSSKFVSLLERCGNSIIKRIVCMWDNYSIDVTAFEFRKKICKLNKENEKAFILLNGGADVYRVKQIADTFTYPQYINSIMP